MGKSAKAVLADANAIATTKSQLAKRGMLSLENAAKLKTAIDKKVTGAIRLLNRRPRTGGRTIASGGLFSSTYGLR